MRGRWQNRYDDARAAIAAGNQILSFLNAHYINDVVGNYYRYVEEGNRQRIQNRSTAYAVPRRIVAPFGADEPFYYSIETYYGSSDHEVFNDWRVGVPGVMIIARLDLWYHLSGDLADKSDPTELKRTVIIGVAAADTIALAYYRMAIRIAAETASNGTHSVVEIKNMLDPQYQRISTFQGVLNYVQVLKLAGLVEMREAK